MRNTALRSAIARLPARNFEDISIISLTTAPENGQSEAKIVAALQLIATLDPSAVPRIRSMSRNSPSRI